MPRLNSNRESRISSGVTLGLVLLAAGAATAIVAGYRAMTIDLRLKRRVRRTKATPIAELKDGQWAKVVGRAVRADASVEAPLSEVDCLYAHAWMEELRDGPNINGVVMESWSDAGQSVVSCDFWLEDESARVFIKLRGDFQVVPMFGLAHYERFAESDQRGQEVVVRDGDAITVVGRVIRNASEHDAGPFRSSGQPPILMSGSSSSPLFLCRE